MAEPTRPPVTGLFKQIPKAERPGWARVMSKYLEPMGEEGLLTGIKEVGVGKVPKRQPYIFMEDFSQGYFDPKTSKIGLNPKIKIKRLEEVLPHEIGHSREKLFKESMKELFELSKTETGHKEIQKIFPKDPIYEIKMHKDLPFIEKAGEYRDPTKIGSKVIKWPKRVSDHASEFFADTYSLLKRSPETIKKLAPSIWKIMSKVKGITISPMDIGKMAGQMQMQKELDLRLKMIREGGPPA